MVKQRFVAKRFRSIAGALVVAVVLTLVAPAAVATAGGMMDEKTGDVNADGVANSVDAAIILQYGAGLTWPTGDPERWQAAADVDCDLVVTSIDASLVLQHDAGLYDLRP